MSIIVEGNEYYSLKEVINIYGTKYFLDKWKNHESSGIFLLTIVRNEIVRQCALQRLKAFVNFDTNKLKEISRIIWNFESDDLTSDKVYANYLISYREGKFIPRETSFEDITASPYDLPMGEIVFAKKAIDEIIASDNGSIPDFCNMGSNNWKILDFYFSKQRWALNECIAVLEMNFLPWTPSFMRTNSDLHKFLEDRLFGLYMDEVDLIDCVASPSIVIQYLCDLGYEFTPRLHTYLFQKNKLPIPAKDSPVNRFYSNWLIKDAWTLDEGSKIICKIDPDDNYDMFCEEFFPERFKKVRTVQDMALRSLKAGTLTCCEGKRSSPYFIPTKVFMGWAINWAIKTGFNLPEELLTLYKSEQDNNLTNSKVGRKGAQKEILAEAKRLASEGELPDDWEAAKKYLMDWANSNTSVRYGSIESVGNIYLKSAHSKNIESQKMLALN